MKDFRNTKLELVLAVLFVTLLTSIKLFAQEHTYSKVYIKQINTYVEGITVDFDAANQKVYFLGTLLDGWYVYRCDQGVCLDVKEK